MANGTIAASQLEILTQSGTGVITVVPPATNTNRTLTLPDATGTVASLGTTLTLATPVTASGTSVDFNSLPSWVKRITVMFSGVSTNGSSPIQVQLGTSGGVQNTGYTGAASNISTATSTSNNSSGFKLLDSGAASVTLQGGVQITLLGANIWMQSAALGSSDAARTLLSGGAKTLTGTLDRVRITTVNGTDIFDAGSINIMYEG